MLTHTTLQVRSLRLVMKRVVTRTFWPSHPELVRVTVLDNKSDQVSSMHVHDDADNNATHHRHHTCCQPGGHPWSQPPSQCDLDGARPRDHRVLFETEVGNANLQAARTAASDTLTQRTIS